MASDVIKPEDVPEELFDRAATEFLSVWEGEPIVDVAAIINAAIEAGLVSPPCHYIAYPSRMPVMHVPGEPIQIFPGKCSGPHHRHWKGQTE